MLSSILFAQRISGVYKCNGERIEFLNDSLIKYRIKTAGCLIFTLQGFGKYKFINDEIIQVNVFLPDTVHYDESKLEFNRIKMQDGSLFERDGIFHLKLINPLQIEMYYFPPKHLFWKKLKLKLYRYYSKPPWHWSFKKRPKPCNCQTIYTKE